MKPALIALAVLALAGCGNKGPLVMPAAPVAEPPPVDAPADAEPTPETLNDANQQPPVGEGTEGGATPPPPPGAR